MLPFRLSIQMGGVGADYGRAHFYVELLVIGIVLCVYTTGTRKVYDGTAGGVMADDGIMPVLPCGLLFIHLSSKRNLSLIFRNMFRPVSL